MRVLCVKDLLSKAVQAFLSEKCSLEQKQQDGEEYSSTESLPPASKLEPRSSFQHTSMTGGEVGVQEEGKIKALQVEHEEEESLQQSTIVVSTKLLSQV